MTRQVNCWHRGAMLEVARGFIPWKVIQPTIASRERRNDFWMKPSPS